MNRINRHKLNICIIVPLIIAGLTHSAHSQLIGIHDDPPQTADYTAIANIGTEISKLSKRLTQIQTAITTIKSVLNIQNDISNGLGLFGPELADIGGGTVGTVIQNAQLGLQIYQSAKSSVTNIRAIVSNLRNDPLLSLSIQDGIEAAETSINSDLITTDPNIAATIAGINNIINTNVNMADATSQLDNYLYTTTPEPDSQTIQSIDLARQTMVQNASIVGMTTASAAATSLANTGQTDIQSLTNAITASTDERGDVQANSAILLKIGEQVGAQNQILAKLIYLRSAEILSGQSVELPTSP